MSFAVVFSGQGHQHAAMLPWLAEGLVLDAMGEALGRRDWRAAFGEDGWARRNANAQVLLTGTALAAWGALAPRLPEPACVAGYSVGELPAFSAAGVFDATAALDLANRRAAAMDRCGEREPGGLLAIGGLSADAIDGLCRDTGVAVAIRNAPDSVVVGGPDAGLDRCEQRAAAAGARTTRLCIAVASHTPWMLGAAAAFERELSAMPLQRPRIVLFSNVAGRVRGAPEAAAALSIQIARTVRWDGCMDDIRSRGPGCVLEIGAGSALARLWNQRFPDIPARSCDEFRSAAAVARWVEDHA